MNNMTFFFAWILGVLTFYLGYALGSHLDLIKHTQTLSNTIKQKMNTSPVGAVTRPTAQQIYYKNNPKEAEADEEMRKSLQKFPELQSHIKEKS